MIKILIKISTLLIASTVIISCSLPIASFSKNLNQAIVSSNDPQTLKSALPAYILLLDSIVAGDAENEDALFASAKMMGAYASLLGAQLELLPEEEYTAFEKKQIQQQVKKLVEKSLIRISTASCLSNEEFCNLTKYKYNDLKTKLDSLELSDNDVKLLYNLAASWASWLQANTDNWSAMAQLPQIKLIMRRVAAKNENIDNAGPHMYLGVLNSIFPASLGGQPEIGQQHFKSAITLSNGQNKMAKVLYAQYYARLIFDKDLHHILLSDVIKETDSEENYRLINTIAIEKAKLLLETEEEYF